MGKQEDLQKALCGLTEWDEFLLKNSGLPGPRGNLELAQAAASLGSREQFLGWLAWDAQSAPVNDPHEFLAFCGVVGLGRLLAEGQGDVLPRVRRAASDGRWRLREACAMALQRWGAADMPALLEEMAAWAQDGSLLELRAAAAGLCEPVLLKEEGAARRTLHILDAITRRLAACTQRRSEEFKVLRQGMAYCWSVAAAACPEAGRPALEAWLDSPDEDVRWMLRQNFQKKRLERADPDWVRRCLSRLGAD